MKAMCEKLICGKIDEVSMRMKGPKKICGRHGANILNRSVVNIVCKFPPLEPSRLKLKENSYMTIRTELACNVEQFS
eukprot:1927230-Amphidinium_carterae.1